MKPLRTLTIAMLVLIVAQIGVQFFMASIPVPEAPAEDASTEELETWFGDMFGYFAKMLLTIPVTIAAIVVWLIWTHRAYSNMMERGMQGRTWGPGWAVGAWFIPLANLVIPFLVFIEIWKGSDPQAEAPFGWKERPLGGLVISWWSFYVAAAALGGVIGFVAAGTPAVYLSATLYAIAGILFAAVIWQTMLRQEGIAQSASHSPISTF